MFVLSNLWKTPLMKVKTKAVSLRDKLKYLLKPDAFSSLPAHLGP